MVLLTMVAAIPATIYFTKQTKGSIERDEAEQIIEAGLLSEKTKQDVLYNLGQPDFQVEVDNELRMQYEIKRKVHALSMDFMPAALCVIVNRNDDQVVEIWISD